MSHLDVEGAAEADRLNSSFSEFARRATGQDPYEYQRRLALGGLPELLRIPTGAGKTLAAVLAWLFRRRVHPDPEVRAATPHWLAFVLPMRVLVEQTVDSVRAWLKAAGLEDEVGLHVVMGGEGRQESRWRLDPERDAIFVGTLDMLVSRALNRGYGASRFAWPIDFGLFNAGVQWVFDEVQLMGPALPTSRQLEGMRGLLGTAMPCRSMWMSATVDEAALRTVDAPEISTVVDLGPEDRTGPLRDRLNAQKLVRQLDCGADPKAYARHLAAGLVAAHRPGQRSIAILNTVAWARALHAELAKLGGPDLVLLHSRFRPDDRKRQSLRALSEVDPAGPGRILVSTQIIEAGVDVSSSTLFTEAAPWPSVVQRAGRCNRDGEAVAAQLLWAVPPKPVPYEESDIAASVAALGNLEGSLVTPESLAAVKTPVKRIIHPVLRRRDLIGVFDTAPDLSGNDIDVGRFIRSGEDLDVLVAWRDLPPAGPDPDDPAPTGRELCPVPLSDLKAEFKARPARRMWRFDHLAEAWVACEGPSDLHPGLVLLLAASEGGYDASTGWNPGSRRPVSVVAAEEESPILPAEEATGADPLSHAPGNWVPLHQHLEHVEAAVRELSIAVPLPGLSADHLRAVAVAARLHDWGKLHTVFQDSLVGSARSDEERQWARESGPWAKSPHYGPRYRQRYFRHELASALAIEAASVVVLDGVAEADLVCYLVGAHHGRVRLAIRSLAGEIPPRSGGRVALGVCDGDVLPLFEADGVRLPSVELDLSMMDLGASTKGRTSWAHRALTLRDRPDLGPFRLGFLEALLRLADWRASAREGG